MEKYLGKMFSMRGWLADLYCGCTVYCGVVKEDWSDIQKQFVVWRMREVRLGPHLASFMTGGQQRELLGKRVCHKRDGNSFLVSKLSK